MTSSVHERLAAVEEELYEAQEELEELRGALWMLMSSDDLERTRRVLLAVGVLATVKRPVLHAIAGAPAVDAASVLATAAEDQAPPWSRHSDRAAGRGRRAPRDRHGMHAL